MKNAFSSSKNYSPLIWRGGRRVSEKNYTCKRNSFYIRSHASTFFPPLFIFSSHHDLFRNYTNAEHICYLLAAAIAVYMHRTLAYTTLWVTQVESAMEEWRLSSENECKLHTLNLLLWYEDSFMYTFNYCSLLLRKRSSLFPCGLKNFSKKEFKWKFLKHNNHLKREHSLPLSMIVIFVVYYILPYICVVLKNNKMFANHSKI